MADLIRQALKVIPAERLVLSSDCGMGREGMSRRHAFYKMVALVQGTNIVRKELGLPVAESLGADPKFSLIRAQKASGTDQRRARGRVLISVLSPARGASSDSSSDRRHGLVGTDDRRVRPERQRRHPLRRRRDADGVARGHGVRRGAEADARRRTSRPCSRTRTSTRWSWRRRTRSTPSR